MYYCLNKGFALCSFKGLPYGLKNVNSKSVNFIGEKNNYMLLYKCNGKNEFDDLSLSEEQKKFINGLVKAEVLSGYEEPHPLDGPIPAELYANRYRHSIQWSITGKCNYKCRHCFQSAPEGVLGQPEFDRIMDMIRQFKECGISEVSITGGEPLIRRDFFDIVDALTEHGIRITTVYTNGALVSEKLLKQFEDRQIHPAFQVSFDGVGWHDWMRGVKGAEQAAVSAIKLLNAHGFYVNCAMSLFRDNLSVVLESIKQLESLGVKSLKLQRCMPQGEWLNEPGHYIEDDELLNFYMDLLEEICNEGIRMSVQMESIYAVIYSDESKKYTIHNLYDLTLTPELYEDAPSCGITLKNFFVGPNGAVVPCMNMCSAAVEELFPNMFQTPLKTILTDSTYLKYSCAKVKEVVEHNEECRSCENVYHCGGGKCRANALGDKKTDYYCKDEFECYIYKSGWHKKLKEKADHILCEAETGDTL